MGLFKKLLIIQLFLSFIFTSFSLPVSLAQTSNPQTQERDLDVKLKQIASSVNELKEKVYRSKAKLKLLEETILLGKITGSKAVIRFKNNTGGLFKLSDSEFYLNERLVHKFNPAKDNTEEIFIYDGETPPGINKMSLKLSFTGADSGVLKLFSYFKDYKFDLESRYEFPVSYGKTTVIKIESIDLGPFKNTLEERLGVRYKTMTEETQSIPF